MPLFSLRSERIARHRSLCFVACAASLLPVAMARAQGVEAKRGVAPVVDWDAVRDETVRHLRRLIQLHTVNPPGNEILVARYLSRWTKVLHQMVRPMQHGHYGQTSYETRRVHAGRSPALGARA
ncbi:MAG: hypothetical protein ACT4PJ_14880, partial [Gemmatimonadaceae bacterium]